MISLKRNNKLELIEATGLRSRKSSIYTPNQTEEFKISRGKFNDFLLCPRCFYLDRVKGIVSPELPGWTLNDTTDILLKKEFDTCREKQTPHRIGNTTEIPLIFIEVQTGSYFGEDDIIRLEDDYNRQ